MKLKRSKSHPPGSWHTVSACYWSEQLHKKSVYGKLISFFYYDHLCAPFAVVKVINCLIPSFFDLMSEESISRRFVYEDIVAYLDLLSNNICLFVCLFDFLTSVLGPVHDIA